MTAIITNTSDFESLREEFADSTCFRLKSHINKEITKLCMAMIESMMENEKVDDAVRKKNVQILLEMFQIISQTNPKSTDLAPSFAMKIAPTHTLTYFKYYGHSLEKAQGIIRLILAILNEEKRKLKEFYRKIFRKESNYSFDVHFGYVNMLRRKLCSPFFRVTPQEDGNPSFEVILKMDRKQNIAL